MQKKSKIEKSKIVKSGLYECYEDSPDIYQRIHYVQKNNYVYYISSTISNEVELVVYNLNNGSIVYSEILVDYLEDYQRLLQVELLLIDNIIHIVYHVRNDVVSHVLYYQEYDIDKKTHTDLMIIDKDIALYDEHAMANLIYQDGNLYFICLLRNFYNTCGKSVAENGVLTIYKYDTSWTKYNKEDIHKSIYLYDRCLPIQSYNYYFNFSDFYEHQEDYVPYIFISPYFNIKLRFDPHQRTFCFKQKEYNHTLSPKWLPHQNLGGCFEVSPSWSPDQDYGFGDFWLPDTHYDVGDIVLFTDGNWSNIYNNMRNDIYWVCEKAGTSGSTFPTTNMRSIPNGTFQDGSVEWRVRCIRRYSLIMCPEDANTGEGLSDPEYIRQGVIPPWIEHCGDIYYFGGQAHVLPWLPGQCYERYEYIREGDYIYFVIGYNPDNPLIYITGSSKPNFPTVHGQTVVDFGITWMCFDPSYIFYNTIPDPSFILCDYPEDFYIKPPHYYSRMKKINNNIGNVQLELCNDDNIYNYTFEDEDLIEQGTDDSNWWLYELKIPSSDFNGHDNKYRFNIKTNDLKDYAQSGQGVVLDYENIIMIPKQSQQGVEFSVDSDSNYIYLSIIHSINKLYEREGELDTKEIYKINLSDLTLENQKHIVSFDNEQCHFDRIAILSDDDYLYLPYCNYGEGHIKLYKVNKSDLTLDNLYDLTDMNEWINTILFSKIKNNNIYILDQGDFDNDEDYIYAIIIFNTTNNSFCAYRIPHLLKNLNYKYADEYIAYNLEEIKKNRLSIIRWNNDLEQYTLEHLFVKSGGGFFFFYENG